MHIKRTLLCAVLVVAGIAAQSPARAAVVDLFLKFDGIDGESTRKSFEKWIEIDTFGFGVENTASSHSSGAGASKPVFSPVTITKPLDSTSPKLFEMTATGKHIKNAILDLVRVGGDKPQKMMEYTFEDVVLTSDTVGGASGGSPTETVSFTYDKIKIQAFSQDPKGGLTELPSVELRPAALQAVPEPSTWAILLTGLVAGAARGRRWLVSRRA